MKSIAEVRSELYRLTRESRVQKPMPIAVEDEYNQLARSIRKAKHGRFMEDARRAVDDDVRRTIEALAGRSGMIAVRLNGQTWAICGGRDFSDQAMFDGAMSQITQLLGCPSKIVEGGAKGADKMAFFWGTRMAVPITEVYADWDMWGKAAGAVRNQKIIDDHKPSVLVAFPGGNGTADMVRRARKAGIDVIEIQPKPSEVSQ